ncbi:hypothetical protein C7475_107243 [Chitinophaga sp. S165]|nr:hypothetical protein C7475_107243 [Chitinophaga sp. S165]
MKDFLLIYRADYNTDTRQGNKTAAGSTVMLTYNNLRILFSTIRLCSLHSVVTNIPSYD